MPWPLVLVAGFLETEPWPSPSPVSCSSPSHKGLMSLSKGLSSSSSSSSSSFFLFLFPLVPAPLGVAFGFFLVFASGHVSSSDAFPDEDSVYRPRAVDAGGSPDFGQNRWSQSRRNQERVSMFAKVLEIAAADAGGAAASAAIVRVGGVRSWISR